MNKILAVVGASAVVLITAFMLGSANIYVSGYPSWVWVVLPFAAIGLCVNALARPRRALSLPAIAVSVAVGFVLAWHVTVGGPTWGVAWLALGIAMPLLGCWLLSTFSLAYRKR